ncbi:hypothetical protein PanWU01x14_112950, partial [Parasponia andersonii]
TSKNLKIDLYIDLVKVNGQSQHSVKNQHVSQRLRRLSQWRSQMALMTWSTALTAQLNGSDSAQISELTQFIATNFRRLVRTPIGMIFSATCSLVELFDLTYNSCMFGTND